MTWQIRITAFKPTELEPEPLTSCVVLAIAIFICRLHVLCLTLDSGRRIGELSRAGMGFPRLLWLGPLQLALDAVTQFTICNKFRGFLAIDELILNPSSSSGARSTQTNR